AAPYEGARAVALENATNLAAVGADPLAAVDCLNGGNPEKPEVYGGFRAVVDGLADMCRELGVPVVGGNVSLYNDSPSGPIPPTPTLAMAGTKPGFEAPSSALKEKGRLLVVGGAEANARRLGGSQLLAEFGGADRFPTVPDDAGAVVDAVADVADFNSTRATHDVSHGGLAVTLAEMIGEAGADVTLPGSELEAAFSESVGRVVVETTDPEAVRERFEGVAPVERIGEATDDGRLALTVGGTDLEYTADAIADLRDTVGATLE
ncbi:phosphoribosylformylglycinamidine synthase II, partial [Halobacteriales archaeon SW_5_68_122]